MRRVVENIKTWWPVYGIVLIFVLIFAFACYVIITEKNSYNNDLFETVYTCNEYAILRHKETGVYYLVGGFSSMTVMLNKDGTAYTGG